MLAEKTHGGIIPVKGYYDEYNDLKNGVYEWKPIRKRNYKFLQKYHVLIGHAYENRQKFEDMSKKAFRKDIIMRAGYKTKYKDFCGNTKYEADSISFAKMDEDTFEVLFKKSIDVILKYVLVGMEENELREAVTLIIGFD